MPISEKIKDIRKKNHLTTKELAEKVGVDIRQVQRWERDISSPPMHTLIAILKMFNETLTIP